MRARIEGHIGAGIVHLAEHAQRRAVQARLRQHRADSGRLTPYLECGQASGPTLVWLHGFADKPDSFMRAAVPLIDRYRIVAPALPGFGDGWFDPRERHTFEAYAAWMSEVLRGIAGPRYHMMGNSLGAAVAAAITAADTHGRVASLVLVDSAGIDVPGVRSVTDEQREGENLFVVRDAEGYERFLARIFARPPYLPRPVRVFLADQLRRSADWYERLMLDLHTSIPAASVDGVVSSVDLAHIRVPTLVVWGERDTLFPVSHGEHLARAIPGAQLEVLKGVGHCPHLESPEQLAAVFRRFETGLGARAS